MLGTAASPLLVGMVQAGRRQPDPLHAWCMPGQGPAVLQDMAVEPGSLANGTYAAWQGIAWTVPTHHGGWMQCCPCCVYTNSH